MGCGSSTVGVETTDNQQDLKIAKQSNGHIQDSTQDQKSLVDKKNVQNKKKKSTTTDSNANIETVSSGTPVPKGVAFEVSFDGGANAGFLSKNPPKRLQKLDPLNVPQLTAEMLAEKQKAAEEKRDKELQRRVSASRKSSRRRRELMMAKEFEQQQQALQQEKIEEQQRLADQKREAKLEEVRARQRLKEERAKRAREKAKRLNQEEPDVELEVEKDDNYNASEGDSWCEDVEAGEHMFGSPKKAHREATNRSLHTTASASTVDSYDNAFMRQPNRGEASTVQDDFFDT